MKKMMRSLMRSAAQRGQSLVELAISLTVILMLLAGAVDFGMAFFSYSALRDAAQEGALYGSINPTNYDGIRQRVKQTSNRPVNLADDTKVFISISIIGEACQGTTNGNTNAIQVMVAYDYPIIMPFLGVILRKQAIPLRAIVTDTILSPVCT